MAEERVPMAEASTPAMTSPASPPGSCSTMNLGNTWSELFNGKPVRER